MIQGLHKMFPVTVRLFDIDFNRATTKVLQMNMLLGRNKSIAQFERNSTNTLFNIFELSWNNGTGLDLDNNNSNLDVRYSIPI